MTHSILTIEHSPSNKQNILKWLAHTGIDITVVENCHDALHVLDRQHPQVILFSSQLPEMPTHKLIRKLKAIAPSAKLVVITSEAEKALNNPLVVRHVHDFLIEPLRQEEVLFNVSQSLKMHRSSLENSYLKEELSFATLANNWQP